MSQKEQIAELLVKNCIEQALELLRSQPNLTIHLQNDVILLQQNYQGILYQEQQALLTYEQVNIEKNKLSRTILHLTDNITAGKPPLTLSNFTEQVPPKNLVLVLLALEIAIGFLGELFPEKIKTNLSDAFGPAYPIVYFTVLGLTIFTFLWFSLRKEKPKTTLNSIDSFSKEEAKIHQVLLERYHSRLKQKTDYRLPITLTLTYTKEGSSPDYLHFSKDMMETQKIEGNLLETLKKHHHILILGDPGAGKTSQILELAVDWLEKDEGHKIPVVFNLSGWKNDGRRFDEWLQEALVSGYGFSKQLAKEAIFKDKILPMLDGLDEVARDLVNEEERNEIRSSCLHCIDQYLSLFEVNYLVICCRRVEYIAAAANAPIKAAVLVNPISPAEIKNNLSEALAQKISTKDENAATTLLNLLPQYPHLETVLCTPFYYNIALELFDERSFKSELPPKRETLQQYLVEHFISEKLTITPSLKGFTTVQTRNCLAWLANTMNMTNSVNFELVSFQPDHLKRKWMCNLVLSIILSLSIGLSVGSKTGWVLGLVSGLVVVLIYNLPTSLDGDFGAGFGSGMNIKPREIRKINWANILNRQVWIKIFVFGLAFGSLLGVVLTLFFSFVLGLGLSKGLLLGFGFALASISVLGLAFGLVETGSFSNARSPYFRLKSEIQFEVALWIITLFPGMMVVFLINGKIKTISEFLFYTGITIVAGLIVGLFNTAFFNHLILRICLFWEKKLPLRWVSLFAYATSARILEQDGGQWRFRHQILQDYFAKKWEEEQAKTKS